MKGAKNKKHIITTQTEHKCVLDSCRFLEQEGFDVTYLPVMEATGMVCMDELENAMRDDTLLLSVMAVNNEIGTRQPVEEIGALCRKKKILFHTDAAQMLGKLPIDVNAMNIDLMSLSSHKIYGPKGVGALYVRRRPRVRLEPLFSGGGQERGLRSGTLAHTLCAGFGAACELAQKEMVNDTAWIQHLSDKLCNGIEERIPMVTRNGHAELRHPGCVNYSFAYVEGESLLMALKNVAVSEPLFSGGGQERGLRSGTLAHTLCAGFGAACELAQKEMVNDTAWIQHLSDKLCNGIEERIPMVTRNGHAELRHPGCVNYSFAYVEGESLLMALKNVAVSSGSACTSASLEPSYVLRALGVDDELAHGSLRFGLGRFTSEDEVDFLLDLLDEHVGRLREMSPLWEMVQEGIDLKSIQWSQDAHH